MGKKFTMHENTIAVLVVNGINAAYCEQLWLEICLRETLKLVSARDAVRIFVWNHDLTRKNEIHDLCCNTYSPWVYLYDEESVDISKIRSPRRKWLTESNNPLSWDGMHAHRAALQQLFYHADSMLQPDVIMTLDTDSWPVRFGWDLAVQELMKTKILAGVWRDELTNVIKPFVHPSGLFVRSSLLKEGGQRLDEWPKGPAEDSLSHLSRHVYRVYGKEKLGILRRSNVKTFHPIFGGVYGNLIYHHHQGTRFTNGMSSMFKGSIERGENEKDNAAVCEEMTHRVFFDYDNYMDELMGVIR